MRLFTPQSLSVVHDQAKSEASDHKLTPTVTPNEIDKVGFIGLGAMGLGMANSLVKAGFHVCGYDVSPRPITEFGSVGGKSEVARSPAEAALDATILILMVQNAAQVEDVLFGSGQAAGTLPRGSVVILNSTVPPSFARSMRCRLLDLGKELDLVDAPVSGGVAKAANGQLTVSDQKLSLLRSMSDQILIDHLLSEQCYYIESKPGPCCDERNPEKSLLRGRRRRCCFFG